MTNHKKPIIFFTILIISLTNFSPKLIVCKECKGPSITPTTITITNNLSPKQYMSVACQSLDDYTGVHIIWHPQWYYFRVVPGSISGISTQYFCQITWDHKNIIGAMFYNDNRDVLRCCGNVTWVATKDGMLGLSTHSKAPPITFPWGYQNLI
ncbi:hypothetical protein RND81_10G173500 [Saponaria officinalis]|uniref:S-protein homolog n=1 Tax=Saponaria officinalis TaxID=3572 RepID=A0AAW1I3Y9_SAPOF